MRLLLTPGKDPPPPLGGQSLSRVTVDNTMRPEHLQISRISTLMFCCCELLTSSYPFQVRSVVILKWEFMINLFLYMWCELEAVEELS